MGSKITLIHGDSNEELYKLSGIDTLLCDPPYGLKFMGKKFMVQWVLWMNIKIELLKTVSAGFGLVQTMVLGMAKFAEKVRRFIYIGTPTNKLKVRFQMVVSLTTFAEIARVVIQTIWRQSRKARIVLEAILVDTDVKSFA